MSSTEEGGAGGAGASLTPVPTPQVGARVAGLCGFAITVATVFSVVAVPLRPVMLAWSPEVLGAVTGSRLAVVALGVAARTGEGAWWALPAAIVSIAKFHWAFWWAGHLWGPAVLGRLAGDRPSARRNIARAEALVRRYEILVLFAAYVPLPLPRELVYAALGASGTRLRAFLVVDLAAAAMSQTAYFAVGYALGESAVPLLRLYATWAVVIAAGLVVMLLGRWWWRRTRGVSTPPTP